MTSTFLDFQLVVKSSFLLRILTYFSQNATVSMLISKLQPVRSRDATSGSQSGPLPARLTGLTSKSRLQLAAVNGYTLDMLPPYIFDRRPVLIYFGNV